MVPEELRAAVAARGSSAPHAAASTAQQQQQMMAKVEQAWAPFMSSPCSSSPAARDAPSSGGAAHPPAIASTPGTCQLASPSSKPGAQDSAPANSLTSLPSLQS
eukprot:scaffold73163_cov18-Tisochrysis_lutea.AAC.3